MRGSIPRIDHIGASVQGTTLDDTSTPMMLLMLAREAELLTDEEIVCDGVRLEPIGRSHPVYRLTVGGRDRAMLKSFGVSRGETDGNIDCERAVASLALERPAIAAAIPSLMPWPPNTTSIAMEVIDVEKTWMVDVTQEDNHSVQSDWTVTVELVVPLIAEVHLSTRDLIRGSDWVPQALRQPLPWSLRLFSGDAPREIWNDGSLNALLSRVGQQCACVNGLRVARSLWRQMSLIHGDLKHDNVLQSSGGTAKIVDWEMASIGDPTWDLAGLAIRLPELDMRGDLWTERALDSAASLIRAYCGVAPIGRAGLITRLPLYVGAWQLMGIVQAKSLGQSDEELAVWIECACHTLANHQALSRSLENRLC